MPNRRVYRPVRFHRARSEPFICPHQIFCKLKKRNDVLPYDPIMSRHYSFHIATIHGDPTSCKRLNLFLEPIEAPCSIKWPTPRPLQSVMRISPAPCSSNCSSSYAKCLLDNEVKPTNNPYNCCFRWTVSITYLLSTLLLCHLPFTANIDKNCPR